MNAADDDDSTSAGFGRIGASNGMRVSGDASASTSLCSIDPNIRIERITYGS